MAFASRDNGFWTLLHALEVLVTTLPAASVPEAGPRVDFRVAHRRDFGLVLADWA